VLKALILINTDSGAESEVSEKLLEIPAVKAVHIVYGVYDIIVEMEVEGYEELRSTVSKIRSIPRVRSTTTLIVTR